jgi:hypothetical protein
MKKIMYTVVILGFIGLMSCGDASLDYSGDWGGTYTEDGGGGAATSVSRATGATPSGILEVTINQNGSNISGVVTFTPSGGAAISGSFTGTVSAGETEITLGVSIPDVGDDQITLTATFQNESSAAGNYSSQLYFGNGTFSITK